MRLPTEQPESSGEPSWRFLYMVSPSKSTPPIVRTRQLTSATTSGSGVVWEEGWEVYDGLMRERQTQALSPEAGHVIVSETTYDGRGLVRDETAPQAVEATLPGMIDVTDWENRTRHLYDELGRITREQWWRDTTVAHESTFAYTEDTVTATPPEGGQIRQVVDGLGRITAVEEHDGTGWQTSSYGYDLSDRLVSVTDPEGNTIDYSYNMAGWRVAQDDPNRGSAAFGYDLVGNQTKVVDANDDEIHLAYDPLGRPVERRADSPTGDLLASWEYDQPGELGLLHRETSHTTGGDWTTEVTGYDERSRPEGTTLTVPSGVPGLSGSYTVTQTYDRADRVTEVAYPAVGGLPAETVTTAYDHLGLPRWLSGSEEYVYWADYDDRRRPEFIDYGDEYYLDDDGDPMVWLAQTFGYDADQRLDYQATWMHDTTIPDGFVAAHDLSYDAVGNVTAQDRTLNGLDWRECYDYDARHRLTEAFTVEFDEPCGEGEPGTGDQTFEHSYSYSADGRILERVEDGDTTTYSYPTSGGDRPHAPTEIDGETYSWDPNGNLAERTVDSDTETYTWDRQQRLSSVQTPDGTTSFVYDPGGQRLLRQTATGATLYFAGHEIAANADGSTVSATRAYDFAGEIVATRTPADLYFMVTDQAGSLDMAIEAAPGSSAVSGSRSYDPYGRVRDHDGDDFATDRGFVGQIEDATTNLSYLQARYYDTSTGIFISTDPLYDTEQPKTLNPYTYAGGNPTTYTDPNGLSLRRIGKAVSNAVGGGRRTGLGIGAGIGATSGKGANKPRPAPPAPAIRAQPNYCGCGAAAALRAMHRANPNPAYWHKLARDMNNLRALRRANPNPAYWTRLAKGQATLSAMRRANPNPAYWRKLSNDVSTLKAMRRANPDPRFWQVINAKSPGGTHPGVSGWAGKPGNPVDGLTEWAEDVGESLAELGGKASCGMKKVVRVGKKVYCDSGGNAGVAATEAATRNVSDPPVGLCYALWGGAGANAGAGFIHGTKTFTYPILTKVGSATVAWPLWLASAGCAI